MATVNRNNRSQKDEIRVSTSSLAEPTVALQNIQVLDTVPTGETLRWVYFATPRKANRDITYDLAYNYGIICCDVWKERGVQKMPNVKQLGAGDLMLLAYGDRSEYRPQLYLRIESAPTRSVDDTLVMHELPGELGPMLADAGYSKDPHTKSFTGFRVTPCSDWKDKIPATLRKPTGQNFIRRWDEVCQENGWK